MVTALLAESATTVVAVGATLDAVAVADGCVTAEITATAGVVFEESLDDGVVTALTMSECVESDPDLAGVDVGCSASAVGAVGVVLGSEGSIVSPEPAGAPDVDWPSTTLAPFVDSPLAGVAVEASDPVALVCAPPLLLTATPDATSVVEEVVPDDVTDELVEDVAWLPVTVDDGDVVLDPPVILVFVAPVEDSAPAAEESVEVDDELDVSALATPGDVTTITPIPKAAAKAPTRPI